MANEWQRHTNAFNFFALTCVVEVRDVHLNDPVVKEIWNDPIPEYKLRNSENILNHCLLIETKHKSILFNTSEF